MNKTNERTIGLLISWFIREMIEWMKEVRKKGLIEWIDQGIDEAR